MATTTMGKKSKADPKPDPEPPDEPTEPASNDIDVRMDALLKDHQAMGARPPDPE